MQDRLAPPESDGLPVDPCRAGLARVCDGGMQVATSLSTTAGSTSRRLRLPDAVETLGTNPDDATVPGDGRRARLHAQVEVRVRPGEAGLRGSRSPARWH